MEQVQEVNGEGERQHSGTIGNHIKKLKVQREKLKVAVSVASLRIPINKFVSDEINKFVSDEINKFVSDEINKFVSDEINKFVSPFRSEVKSKFSEKIYT